MKEPKANTLRVPIVFMPTVVEAVAAHGNRRKPLTIREGVTSQNVWLPGAVYEALAPAIKAYRQREAELLKVAADEARKSIIPALERALDIGDTPVE